MEQVEVAVVGGGAAGLATALTLARACRTVMVFDGGPPRNASAPAVRGFLSRDGTAPAAFLAAARAELAPYERVSIRDARVSQILGTADAGFTLDAPGGPVSAARVILATGLRDQLPSLPGFAELWGSDIFHCPYCHGWEVAGRRWGVVAYDRRRVARKLPLLRNWTDDLVLFVDAADTDDDDDRSPGGIAVERRPIVRLVTDGARLRAVTLHDGARRELDALLWPVRQRLPRLIVDLQLALDAEGHVLVGDDQQTSRPGIFAAGDLSSFDHQQVVHAASSGVAAAKAVVRDLTRARIRTGGTAAATGDHALPPRRRAAVRRVPSWP